MRRRRSIRTAVVATLALGGSFAASALLAAPASAWTNGACTSANGVTVVVDFQALGGSTITRCADVVAGTTGLAALKAAGISVTGTSRWGEAFICRLAGRPAADETLHIPGGSDYREPCIDTPPSAAHWTSWHASNGGSWTYSQSGASSRAVTIGGFEGWSFAFGASASSDPPPRVTPTRPEPAPDPAASGGQGTDNGSAGGSQGSGGSQATDSNGNGSRGQGTGASGTGGQGAGGRASGTSNTAAGDAGSQASTTGAGSGVGSEASTTGDPSSADPAPTPTSSVGTMTAELGGKGGGDANASGTGPRVPVSTAAAAGVLVLAVGAGAGTLWRRRGRAS